jgi:hypothetical protein
MEPFDPEDPDNMRDAKIAAEIEADAAELEAMVAKPTERYYIVPQRHVLAAVVLLNRNSSHGDVREALRTIVGACEDPNG